MRVSIYHSKIPPNVQIQVSRLLTLRTRPKLIIYLAKNCSVPYLYRLSESRQQLNATFVFFMQNLGSASYIGYINSVHPPQA